MDVYMLSAPRFEGTIQLKDDRQGDSEIGRGKDAAGIRTSLAYSRPAEMPPIREEYYEP